MTELQKMISQCLNDDCWYRLASYLAQFQFKIIIYKEISHSVNQIRSGHNFLVIPVSPWFPDAGGLPGLLLRVFGAVVSNMTSTGMCMIPCSWYSIFAKNRQWLVALLQPGYLQCQIFLVSVRKRRSEGKVYFCLLLGSRCVAENSWGNPWETLMIKVGS